MMSDEESYVVEAIHGWRYNKRLGRKEYWIKWENYDKDDNTWEPEDNLNCPDLLAAFESKLEKSESSLYFSPDLDNLTGFERNASFECLGPGPPHDDNDDTKFYVYIRFEDSDDAEEVYFHEFYKRFPKEALEFLESRLYFESDSDSRSDPESVVLLSDSESD